MLTADLWLILPLPRTLRGRNRFIRPPCKFDHGIYWWKDTRKSLYVGNVFSRTFLVCLGCLGDQSWVFIGRTDAEAETPILWPPHEKSWLIGKDPDAGRDWGQEEKGTTKDEMAGWHYRLDGHESEWTPGDGVGQGGLACCDSWGLKEWDTTERLNWTELRLLIAEKPVIYGFMWHGWLEMG